MSTFRGKYRIESARLKGYDYGRNGSYFVTICTHNRKEYFGEIIESPSGNYLRPTPIGQIAIDYWKKIPEIFPFIKLDEFVFMPNHMHGILIISKAPVETHKYASHDDVGEIPVETHKYASRDDVEGMNVETHKYASHDDVEGMNVETHKYASHDDVEGMNVETHKYASHDDVEGMNVETHKYASTFNEWQSATIDPDLETHLDASLLPPHDVWKETDINPSLRPSTYDGDETHIDASLPSPIDRGDETHIYASLPPPHDGWKETDINPSLRPSTYDGDETHIDASLPLSNIMDDETHIYASLRASGFSEPPIYYENKFGPQSRNLSSIIRGYKGAVKAFATTNGIEFEWQKRFYDHIIRDEKEFQFIRDYIRSNPKNWRNERNNQEGLYF